MVRNILLGAAAGAAGTAALNTVTYLDMTVRGRPPSGVPANVVEEATWQTGTPLKFSGEDEEVAENRNSGAGLLFGYDAGPGVGALYGLLHPKLNGVPRPPAGVGLGAAAMLSSDVPATVLGVTDPQEWDMQNWVSDIVPHLAYGLVTAMVMHEFRQR